jgi:uncharacterized protein (DUF1778 family)
MKTLISIRIDPGQKTLFSKAAAQAGENLTEFLVNSAMLRIQKRELEVKPENAMQAVDRIFLASTGAVGAPNKTLGRAQGK